LLLAIRTDLSIFIQNSCQNHWYDAYGTSRRLDVARAHVWVPTVGGRDDCRQRKCQAVSTQFLFPVFGVNFYSKWPQNHFVWRLWDQGGVSTSPSIRMSSGNRWARRLWSPRVSTASIQFHGIWCQFLYITQQFMLCASRKIIERAFSHGTLWRSDQVISLGLCLSLSGARMASTQLKLSLCQVYAPWVYTKDITWSIYIHLILVSPITTRKEQPHSVPYYGEDVPTMYVNIQCHTKIHGLGFRCDIRLLNHVDGSVAKKGGIQIISHVIK